MPLRTTIFRSPGAPGRTVVAALLCLCMVCAVPLQAMAQGEMGEPTQDDLTAQVEALSAEGTSHFRNGEYTKAIDFFLRAYDLTPVANLLYNIALSYERLEKPKQAITYYERFIIADDANPETRTRALERVRELERQIKAREDSQKPPPPRNTKPEPKKGLGTWASTGIIVGGAGVVLAGTGAVFGILSQSSQGDFNSSRVLREKQDARDSAESNALTADILYIGGGAAILAGATMLIWDLTSSSENEDQGQEPQSWRIAPTIGANSVGATLQIPLAGF